MTTATDFSVLPITIYEATCPHCNGTRLALVEGQCCERCSDWMTTTVKGVLHVSLNDGGHLVVHAPAGGLDVGVLILGPGAAAGVSAVVEM